ncbi:BRCA1-A complex subunit Abraxas 1 isoform X1 [Solea solea]|uniref:BRCA1-A complex subunit Abraxas 1 isoform X1 n=1 Tax=Solea solea TaxID=90069 RepID=UPI00272C384B|nr:BRCA1-A complex subunit Abraxas 1 isoform X1 [Solea solea]
MAEPSVQMSGIVLASLMFQHVNSNSDVEGLVLGQSRVDEQITISDSQADHIHIEEIYNVQKYVAFHESNHLYNSVGDVDMEAVKKILADDKQQSVIGWYRQRRNTEQQMTFREKIVHEKLRTSLSNPHLVFVLLTSTQVSSIGSTHRMEYAAFISLSSHFLRVPVLVTNLGLLDQLAYWKTSAPFSATGYNLAMKKHGSRFFSSNGLLKEVNEMNKMNESLQTELQKACADVEETERQVETLQAEVSALRKIIEEKKRSKAGKETVAVPSEEKNNVLLCDAVKALFSCSPLFHTQTVTLDAFPVPDGCCSSGSNGHVSMAAQTKSDAPNSSTATTSCRLRQTLARRKRKRWNTES